MSNDDIQIHSFKRYNQIKDEYKNILERLVGNNVSQR